MQQFDQVLLLLIQLEAQSHPPAVDTGRYQLLDDNFEGISKVFFEILQKGL